MIPAAVPQAVNYFKGRWTKYPTLDTAAKFMSRNLGILNNPKIQNSGKKQAINRSIHL